jgi:dephospho-CoA kinase
MTVLGLTGGVGMGKSTTAGFLTDFGIPVIDTDLLARAVVEPGQPALAEIQASFGNEMVDSSGHLDRRALATRVFGDSEQRNRLEAIVHPRIRELWTRRLAELSRQQTPVAAVVIPLLFETHAERVFDFILCASCSLDSQRRRLAARRWTEQEIRQRIAAQAPATKKMELSHFVIWTEGSLDVHRSQLDRILGQIGVRCE